MLPRQRSPGGMVPRSPMRGSSQGPTPMQNRNGNSFEHMQNNYNNNLNYSPIQNGMNGNNQMGTGPVRRNLNFHYVHPNSGPQMGGDQTHYYGNTPNQNNNNRRNNNSHYNSPSRSMNRWGDRDVKRHELSGVYRGNSPNPHQDVNNMMSAAQWTKLDISNSAIRFLAPALFEYQHITHLVLKQNRLKTLPPAICELSNLVKLDVSENEIQTLPKELCFLQLLRDVNLSDNLLTQLPFQLSHAAGLVSLAIANNPLPEVYLSVIEKGTDAIYNLLVEKSPISEKPQSRPWTMVENYANVDGGGGKESFTVVSYNVLCDMYATPLMYRYCPSRALNWETRKMLVLNELIALNADVITLQEVETSAYHVFFTPELQKLGYDSVFYPKLRARTMGEKERMLVDGCAIFYRASKFRMYEKYLVDFRGLAVNINAMCSSEDMINRVMTKDNIGVVVRLESRVIKQQFYLATTHLHWNPEFKDVKVIQTALLLDKIKSIQNANNPTSSWNSNVPVIITGDFNSLYDSGVYKLMSEGKVDRDNPDFENTDYGDYVANGIGHNFGLGSAYATHDILYTNYTYDFKGMIDYIWYSKNDFVVSKRLGDIPENYMDRFAGLPNDHFGSDHIPLMAEFTFV